MQFPQTPELADEPISAKTGLFRGAIALAVNGVPIFNALNNRGDDAFLVGELDEFGGRCGRADGYHYHGTTTYPYLNGGLVGVVTVSDQADPQPVTPAFRPAGEPLTGAVITGFDDFGDGAYRLEFTSPAGEITTETYSRG